MLGAINSWPRRATLPARTSGGALRARPSLWFMAAGDDQYGASGSRRGTDAWLTGRGVPRGAVHTPRRVREGGSYYRRARGVAKESLAQERDLWRDREGSF